MLADSDGSRLRFFDSCVRLCCALQNVGPLLESGGFRLRQQVLKLGDQLVAKLAELVWRWLLSMRGIFHPTFNTVSRRRGHG